MFTGIIGGVGTLLSLDQRGRGFHISVQTAESFALGERARVGDSIACNGVCLTAAAVDGGVFQADVSAETVARTAFRHYRRGRALNLELACTPSTPLGGHIVQGHVDGVGSIAALDALDEAVSVRIRAPRALLRYIAPRGSIAVDGVSLTVNEVDGEIFRLTLIPHTQTAVSFAQWIPGAEVNLEADVLSRYLERLLECREEPGGELTLETLAANGFV